MKSPAFKKIVIIGLGLMGGSLAAAARKKFPNSQIVGVSRSRNALNLAFKRKWITERHYDQNLEMALTGADFVVICTPVDLIFHYLGIIDKSVQNPVVVTDVGSAQNSTAELVKRKKWKYVRYVGAHPMVGSDARGIHAAKPSLYENGVVIITGESKKPGFRPVVQFWKEIAREVSHFDPKIHDNLIAQISHLPHLLSTCLMLTASKASLKVAATGFKDMTRLANGAESIWAPIFTNNKTYLIKALSKYKKELAKLEHLVKSNDTNGLRKVLRNAAELRNKWERSKKNIACLPD
ncbi:MAG TPA: hypothetical protein DIS66_01170 [Candidatus Omnitrophica bacterium]|nr:hypothetical protein [Candidatus Omnitrophota bacterium]